MEKIGNAGWFLTNEEYKKIAEACDILTNLFKTVTLTSDEGTAIPSGPQPIKINEPCPQCPWKNPADWTWRPWQAPWYGEPIFKEYKVGDSDKDYKVGDGEWWKNYPYCTNTTEDNPNAVKESKTTGDEETEIKVHKTIDEDWCR